MVFDPFPTAASGFWPLLSRLGEAQLLLPALALAAAWLAAQPGGRRAALAWLGATGLAAALTTASKVAFIGHGLGWAALDFTGFSGHAMFAAAVLPGLARLLAAPVAGAGAAGPLALSGAARGRAGAGGAVPADGVARRLALGAALGWALAAAVAVSRVAVQAHSWSEVLSGFALGAVVHAALRAAGPWPVRRRPPLVAPLLLLAVALGVAAAPPPRTHDWVTRLALAQAGRERPFQRADLHRGALPRPPAWAPAGAGGRAPAAAGGSLQAR